MERPKVGFPLDLVSIRYLARFQAFLPSITESLSVSI